MYGTSARAAPHHPELLHPSSQTCMLASLYRHITDAHIHVYVYIYIYIYIQSPSELSGGQLLLISTLLQDPKTRQAQRDAPSAHFVAVVALARSDRSAHEALVSERHISLGSRFPSFGLGKT